VAVPYLAAGVEAIREVRGQITLYGSRPNPTRYGSDNSTILIESPAIADAGPVAETFREADKTSDLAAYAAYLLVLLNDRTGYDLLRSKAREHEFDDPWGRLAYRAITKLNDGEQMAYLEEIFHHYQKEGPHQSREFYWTIRSMTGEKILKLRKTIRDQVGMEKLR
jgi:hypothetical protein